MDGRVSVNLAGGRLQNFGAGALGQSQHVDGAMHAGLGGLHGIELVMHGRGRAGEVINLVGFHIERERDVMAHQLKGRVGQELGDILAPAGEKVIDAQDLVTVGEKPFAEVRADEPRAACHDDTFH